MSRRVVARLPVGDFRGELVRRDPTIDGAWYVRVDDQPRRWVIHERHMMPEEGSDDVDTRSRTA